MGGHAVLDARFPLAVFWFYAKGPHEAQNPLDLVPVCVTTSRPVVEKPARALTKPNPLRNAGERQEDGGTQ
jgi:hypothetical protein